MYSTPQNVCRLLGIPRLQSKTLQIAFQMHGLLNLFSAIIYIYTAVTKYTDFIQVCLVLVRVGLLEESSVWELEVHNILKKKSEF